MSWETNLMVHLRYNRKSYTSKYEVESDLEHINDMIKYHTTRLHNLAIMTEPKKFIDEEYDPLQWISNEVKDSLEELEEYYVDKYKLELLLEYWDKCHTKEDEPIHAPENVGWDDAYIDGDFILTKEEEEKQKQELGLK